MQITKELEMAKLDSASVKIRVISHPIRIKILQLLEDSEKMNVTQLYTKLKILQAETSHHLGLLHTQGLIRKNREGKCSFYSLNKAGVSKVISHMNALNEIR
jgi:DNA-binding transcriptional ArsR family regulator